MLRKIRLFIKLHEQRVAREFAWLEEEDQLLESVLKETENKIVW